ncbi:MAG: hypothetical protein SGPRY_012404, partial [Prymnesium sp.]
AIAREILARAGEHNNQVARPVASIAAKLLSARHENPSLPPEQAFKAFDLDAFMLRPSGSRGGEASAKASRESITFQTRILNQHLVCTLCMGYFKDACTIIECLHTFCRNCIMRHICESNTCPQCDSQLGTNPKDLVRTDRTLQSIVDKVFPQFARTAEQAKRPEKRSLSPVDDGKQSKAAKGAGELGVGGEGEREEVVDEVSFSLCEAEPRLSTQHGTKLEKPFLRTKSHLTVAQLKKYLARKMSLTAGNEIDVLCRKSVMPPEITLDRILKEHWKNVDDLVLHYRVFHRKPSADAK